MPRTNALIFTSTNFQFVRSIVNVYGPSDGMRDVRYPATASKSRTICAIKRWMRRKLDSREALLSNAPASLERHTVCKELILVIFPPVEQAVVFVVSYKIVP